MSENKQIRSVIYILATVALVIVAVIALVLMSAEEARQSASDAPGGDFVLNSNSGPVTLSQFRGKAVLLFFGYTHCPDVCPTTMTHVADALDLLSEKELEQVQPIFITVDPERDSAEHLAKYVGFFHPKLIGLTGRPEAIKEAARSFSVEYFVDRKADAGKGNYLINHTSYLFLLNGSGEVVDMMSSATTAEDIATALRKQISR